MKEVGRIWVCLIAVIYARTVTFFPLKSRSRCICIPKEGWCDFFWKILTISNIDESWFCSPVCTTLLIRWPFVNFYFFSLSGCTDTAKRIAQQYYEASVYYAKVLRKGILKKKWNVNHSCSVCNWRPFKFKFWYSSQQLGKYEKCNALLLVWFFDSWRES